MGVILAVVVCVADGGGGVSVMTRIPCVVICVATNESLVAPNGMTIAVIVDVAVGVAVSVI